MACCNASKLLQEKNEEIERLKNELQKLRNAVSGVIDASKVFTSSLDSKKKEGDEIAKTLIEQFHLGMRSKGYKAYVSPNDPSMKIPPRIAYSSPLKEEDLNEDTKTFISVFLSQIKHTSYVFSFISISKLDN